jgi:hypothetical protein
MNQVDQVAAGLIVERHGAHVLVRRHDDVDADSGSIGWPEPVAGQVFVLVSSGAARDRSVIDVLPSLLHRNVVTRDVESVRIGLPGLGKDPWVSQALSDALGVEIVAPDGDFVATSGAALYAGHGTDDIGWLRFRPGLPPVPGGRRHPAPRWEAAMPATPVTVAGTTAEPVPAGVVVRRADGRPVAPGHAAFAIAVDPDTAKIIVGADDSLPGAAAVAAVVARLPSVPAELVLLTAAAGAHSWLREFASSLDRDVVVSSALAARPGAGQGSFPQPFVAKLRQRVDGSQELLEAVTPPPGWQRRDVSGYRLGEVMADVVPSGVVLRTGAADPAALKPPFDPAGWTLHLGTPGEPIGPELLTAAENLLGELEPGQRDVAQLRLAGVFDDRAKEMFDREPVAGPPQPVPAVVREAVAPAPGTARQTGVGTVPAGPRPTVTGEQSPPVPEAARGARGPVMPLARMMSGSPVPTVSGAPGSVPAPGGIAPARGSQPSGLPARPPSDFASSAESGPRHDAAEVRPGREASGQTDAVPAPIAVQPDGGLPAPVPEPENSGRTSEAPAAPSAAPSPDLLMAQGHDVPPRPDTPALSGKRLVIADRSSTAAEQTRFTAATGEAYGEALATVNAALASWPSMRQKDASAVKADYVAVCLYLGRGLGSFTGLNTVMRIGDGETIDGQLHCLVSGLRRLPTHRRAVLRQSRAGQRLERESDPGTILTEPGFLVGSMDLDIAVPGADLDILIWPASARRTSELMIGQTVNEAVFFAGARFKALAVRAAEPVDEESEDEEPATPRAAALFRELAPNEPVPSSGELDERDLAVLAKLDQVLERRRRGALRAVDEPEVISRLTTSLLEWQEDTTSPATRTAMLAS